MTVHQTIQRQKFCDQASDWIWQLLNARLVLRALAPMPVGSKRISLASELPQDHESYGKVLLRMDGMRFRMGSKATIPLLDANGDSVRSIIGSVRNIVTHERQLLGDIVFATDGKAQATASKWQDGHLCRDDLVLNFAIDEREQVAAGKNFMGFEGPLSVATRWSPLSVQFKP